ncbi:MAG: hypothetical protein ACRDRY_10890 [Pseudonocardiaceae bacterium]
MAAPAAASCGQALSLEGVDAEGDRGDRQRHRGEHPERDGGAGEGAHERCAGGMLGAQRADVLPQVGTALRV